MENSQVLIVDDDNLTREMVLYLLKKAEISAIGADNAKTALEILHQNSNIFVIILDLNMPIMDGYQFLVSAKELVSDRKVKIIVTSCTDHGHFLAVVKSEKIDISSVVDYLEKPVRMQRLILKINKLMGRNIEGLGD